jgi:O-antigen/teichoic acid export membrane protein
VNVKTRVLQNTTALIIGQSLGVGLTFLSSVFIVRALGATGYGQYAFIYAFLSLFGWFVPFGTDSILVREAAKASEGADAAWSNGLVLQLVLAGVACVAMLLISIGLGYEADVRFLLLLGGIEFILLQPWRLVSRVFQAELQQWRAVLATLVRQVVWLGLLVVLAARSVPLSTLVWVRTGTAVLEVSLMWLLVRPFFRVRMRFDLSSTKGLLGQSWPLALVALSVAIYHRIDRVLIEHYLHAEELGYYATAANVATLINIVPLAFMASVYPLLCQRAEHPASFERISDTSFRWVLIGSFGLAALFSMLGDFLIVYVYGEEFTFSGELLGILAWAQVAVCYGVVISQILLSRNLQRYLIASTTAGAVVNAFGNVLVLPRFGVLGAAWMIVFTQILSAILLFSFIPATRKYGRQGLKILLKVVTAGVISLVLSTRLNLGDVVAAALFAGLFGVSLVTIGLLTKGDLEMLRKALSGPGIRATLERPLGRGG